MGDISLFEAAGVLQEDQRSVDNYHQRANLHEGCKCLQHPYIEIILEKLDISQLTQQLIFIATISIIINRVS